MSVLLLEIQCSSLSQDRLWERSHRYRRLAIKSSGSWERNSGSETLTPLAEAIPIFQSKHGFSYQELDEERRT